MELRQELLAKMGERVRLSRFGAELQESEEEKARRIIAEEIRRLRQETTVLLRRIAEELEMGSVRDAAKLITRG